MAQPGHAATLPGGTMLTHEGTPVRHVYLVERGCVWLHRHAVTGAQASVAIRGRGAFIGLGPAVLGQPHAATATVHVSSVIVATAAERVTPLDRAQPISLSAYEDSGFVADEWWDGTPRRSWIRAPARTCCC